MTKMIVLQMPALCVRKRARESTREGEQERESERRERARARETARANARARERESSLARDSAHVGIPTCAALHGVCLYTNVQRRSALTPRVRSLFDFSVVVV